jgi:hypothetical protein
MVGSMIDTTTLLKVVGASLVAGVGVTTVFSLAVYGAVRASDLRRANRVSAAGLFAALTAISVSATVAAIVYGIVLTTQKA